MSISNKQWGDRDSGGYASWGESDGRDSPNKEGNKRTYSPFKLLISDFPFGIYDFIKYFIKKYRKMRANKKESS